MATPQNKSKGRGWHGNSEGHAAVARKKGRSTANTATNQSSTTVRSNQNTHAESENSSRS